MLRIKEIKFIPFFLLILSGCNKIKNNDIVAFELDTINIPINEDYLNTYPVLSTVEGYNFYGLNSKLSKIDVFDLSTKQVLKSVQIEKEGVNGIPLIDNFDVCNSNLIIDGRINYVFVNNKGEILKKLINEDLSIDEIIPDYTFLRIKPVNITNFLKMCYSCDNQLLFFPVYPKDISEINTIYEGPCTAQYNLKDNTLKILPITYPKIFKQGKYYGNLDQIQLTFNGDSLIYNFPNSSDIFVFNLKTENTTIHSIKSDFTANKSKPLKFNAERPQIADHFFQSLFFHRLVYDKYRKLYYRLHTDEYIGEDFFESKKKYMTIMDERLEKIAELSLPQTIYPIYHVLPDGIMLQLLKTKDEDFFSYILLKFKEDWWVNSLSEIKEVFYDIEEENNIKIDSANNLTVANNLSIPKDKSIFPNDKEISYDLIKEFVNTNMIYPPKALEKEWESVVHMLFQYDNKGNVFDYRILTGCEYKDLEDEAWRLTKLIKKVKTKDEGGHGFPIVFDIKKYNLMLQEK